MSIKKGVERFLLQLFKINVNMKNSTYRIRQKSLIPSCISIKITVDQLLSNKNITRIIE